MHHSSFFSIAMPVAFSIALASCGGGSSTPPAQPPTVFVPVGAEGLYAGTSSGSDVTTLILDDGTFYSAYSAYQNPSVIGFFVQGKGSVTNGVFRSSDMRTVSLGARNVSTPNLSFQASYEQGKSLHSSLELLSLATSDAMASSDYEAQYEQPAKLADVAADYGGTISVGSTNFEDTAAPISVAATLAVSASGALSGTVTGGCMLSGTLTPRVKGNVFNATIVFGDAPCVLPKATVSGHAFMEPKTKRLYVVAMISDGSKGVLFAGAKN